MARQQAHNRRAGRGGGGSSWISYSDIMAALVMTFVLFLVYALYNYGSQIRQITIDLGLKEQELAAQTIILLGKQEELDSKNAELREIRLDLAAKEGELAAQTIILIGKQQELDAKDEELARIRVSLKTQEEEVRKMQLQLGQQSRQLSALVGVRPEIIQELSEAMSSRQIPATVDDSGNITLESSVFFEVNSYVIRADGQAMLNQFLPVYLDVLMRPEYADYLGEIIIEGHTDSSGDYLKNLRLSQNRAMAVVEYCLNIVPERYRSRLQELLTAKGRSYSDLVYYPGTTIENAEASRRVVFKFSLRDAEMVQQMNTLLQEHYGDDALQLDDPTLP